ncbi:MAG TPA: NUDIX domain-containing protein [Desulfobacteraceae bacterium]|nr:NUDIX domain-containing protein [Desulfobacteraceae bacterium]HPJ67028.1 NUDIX domain-containing protein [Desulfobacteraceae bacterium]HPQ27294.1 NUDIX domain-containing protein [Desulfobacteraceae bacterium]
MDDANTFPVPVARLIIPNHKNEVLILRRAHSTHASGSWCLPGGKIDYGDTVEESAVRELEEETSLTCDSLKFLFYQDSLPPEPGTMHCINLYFKCTASGKIVLNSESSQFAWIGPEGVKNYEIAFRNDEALIKYWKDNGSI